MSGLSSRLHLSFLLKGWRHSARVDRASTWPGPEPRRPLPEDKRNRFDLDHEVLLLVTFCIVLSHESVEVSDPIGNNNVVETLSLNTARKPLGLCSGSGL